MHRKVTTSSATWKIETLPDGSMGDLDLLECRRITPIKIEDGLIVRCPSISYEGFEFKGQLVSGVKEILFTIASGVDSLTVARRLANDDLIVKALTDAGWVLREVWRVQPNEF